MGSTLTLMLGLVASKALISLAVLAPSEPRPPLVPPWTANTIVCLPVAGTCLDAAGLPSLPLLPHAVATTMVVPSRIAAAPRAQRGRRRGNGGTLAV